MKKINVLSLGFLILLSNSCSTSYVTQATDESFEQLTKITDIGKPCFGPNGGNENKDLFFSVLEEGGYFNIYRKENATLPAISQKTFGNGLFLWPNYNEENGQLVFQNFDGRSFNIFTINATSKGKAITSITNTDENDYNPAWSPDGTKIIFEKGVSPKEYVRTNRANKKAIKYQSVKISSNQLWVKNLESGELKMIGNGSFPKFSPDGKYIAYVKYESVRSKGRSTIIGTIWIMTTDGETNVKLTNANTGYATRPNWAPNSRSIIFQLTKKDKIDSDLYSIDITGENLMQFTTNISNDFAPYWTNDGYIFDPDLN